MLQSALLQLRLCLLQIQRAVLRADQRRCPACTLQCAECDDLVSVMFTCVGLVAAHSTGSLANQLYAVSKRQQTLTCVR
jgi:hypothetical protein